MKRFFLSGLDTPFTKDWIFWLWAVSVVAIIPQTLGKEGGLAGLINFVIAIFAQWCFFLFLPSFVRTMIRQKKTKE